MLGPCLKSRTSLLDTVSTTRGSGWVAHQTCDFANGFELVCLTHPAGGTDCIQAGAKTFEAKPPMLVFAESPSAFAVHDHPSTSRTSLRREPWQSRGSEKGEGAETGAPA